jgi:uncharacterized spore protein YtfJ
MILDEIKKKMELGLDITTGIDKLFGDPISVNGIECIPVAKVVVEVSASAMGEGAGGVNMSDKLKSLAKGGGEGEATSDARIEIIPVGLLQKPNDEEQTFTWLPLGNEHEG